MNVKSGHRPTIELVSMGEEIESMNAKVPSNLRTLGGGNLAVVARANYYTSPVSLTSNGVEHGLILDTNARLMVNSLTSVHSFSSDHSLSIVGHGSQTTPTTDLGADSGAYKINVAGTTDVNNIDIIIEVSNDNATFYDYNESIFTISAGKISGSFDLTFRYYRLKITDNSGSTATVNLIESGKTF